MIRSPIALIDAPPLPWDRPPLGSPIFGPDFIGPLPTGSIQRGEDGGRFLVLHRPAPDNWWLIAHNLPIPEDLK